LVAVAATGHWFASEFLEEIKIWEPFIRDPYAGPIKSLKQVATDAFMPSVLIDLHDRFLRQDGIRVLWPREKHRLEKYILLRHWSEFYIDVELDTFYRNAHRAAESRIVQENFVEFLNLIESGLKNEQPDVSRHDVFPLACDTEVISAAWKAATAKALQMRAMGSLNMTRNNLIAAAGVETHLPLPPWWITSTT
jgi:hypothetical protein